MTGSDWSWILLVAGAFVLWLCGAYVIWVAGESWRLRREDEAMRAVKGEGT